MLKLKKYVKYYLWQIAAVFILLYFQAQADLALPDYMSDIINNGIAVGDLDYILPAGLKMLGVALIGTVCTVAVGFLAARIAAGISMRLRDDVF